MVTGGGAGRMVDGELMGPPAHRHVINFGRAAAKASTAARTLVASGATIAQQS